VLSKNPARKSIQDYHIIQQAVILVVISNINKDFLSTIHPTNPMVLPHLKKIVMNQGYNVIKRIMVGSSFRSFTGQNYLGADRMVKRISVIVVYVSLIRQGALRVG